MSDTPEDQARRIFAESGDPTGWFEQLYAASETGGVPVPWDRAAPHPLIAEWAAGRSTASGRALVVGCGLGEDAELVARLGYATTAFDLSATAIRTARERFPDSPVDYRVADLLAPPAEWASGFDLVLESLTVQSLPVALRPAATARVSSFVAPRGTLLVVATARDAGQEVAGPPWPLSPAELEAFATGDLEPVRIERIDGRWRAELRRG